MRKKLLILASLTTSVSPIFAISCKENINDEVEETKPVLPNYDISEMVKDLNYLEFKRQFPQEEFANYNCDNSWFSVFEASDKIALFSEKAAVKNTSQKIVHQISRSVKNDSDHQQTFHLNGFDELIPRQGENELETTKKLEIDQDFLVFGPNLLHGGEFNIGKNELIDKSTLTFKIKERDVEVEPHSSLEWSAKIQATFQLYQDFLVFNLAQNTTIMTKFTNLTNGEDLYMQYSLETLLSNSLHDDHYQAILSQKDGFFKKVAKNKIQMQVESRLLIISDYRIITEELK